MSDLPAGPGTGIEGLESLRRANFERLLDRLELHADLNGLSVLEVGAARGWFLEAAARRGAIVKGIEPEAINAEIARKAGFDVEIGLFPEDLSDRGPYDMIVFNDVFEHIPGPSSVIVEVAALLNPGGRAVINLPSSRGVLFRIAQIMDSAGMSGPHDRLWQMGFPSPHVSYFSPSNLKALGERHAGLKQIDAFGLPSLRREGLWPRIRSSHSGPIGLAMYGMIWPLSFVLGALPADVHVGVFAKCEGVGE